MLNRFAMILGCALALAACGGDNNDAPAADSGVQIADSGQQRRDASTADAAVEPEGCRDPLTALPSQVLPRCAPSTLTAVRECTFPPTAQEHVTCVTDGLDADTTAPFTQTANGQTISLDCSGCVNYMQIVCMQEIGCQTEVSDFLCCTAACTTDQCVQENCLDENEALIECASEDPTNYARCLGFAGSQFGSTSCFAPAAPSDAGTPADAAAEDAGTSADAASATPADAG